MPLAIQRYIVLGNIGSDAGYWYWDGKGWHHVGGWGVEQLAEVTNALQVMATASRLKTQGLAESVTKSVSEFVNKELGAHLGKAGGEAGGVTVVVIAGR